MVLMPWSSQAQGFFAMSDEQLKTDYYVQRSWLCPDNLQRLARARELAAKKGVPAINIALAYVLCQPFPTFPLIGPRTLQETRIATGGLDMELTPDEIKWLNLEE